MDIVEGEPRLETDDIGRARGKGLGGEAELAGLGNVLGVEHGEQAAAGKGERIVQGLGLGQRQGRRHDDNVELGRQGQGRQGAAGLLIVSLDHELDVELVPGIAERRQASHQLLQDVGLSMERRQDRVDRQLGVGEPRLTANGRGPPTEETGPAQGGEGKERRRGERRNDRGPEDRGDDEDNRGQAESDRLGGGQPSRRREMGAGAREPEASGVQGR